MTATSVSPSRVDGGSLDLLAERAERWALPVILLVAGLNFFWQLGSSSYFIDEAFSVIHSLPSFHTMFHVIGHTETTPYTYFLFLHEWMIRTGSQAEWVTRLPSAVAGVVLVAAVYWMAKAFVGRRAALGAAALTAISPLIQSYAQETRVYIFLMLGVVVAVGASVRAVQQPERRTALLTVGALACFLSLWLHYTAVSVVFPLAVWVATRPELTRRARAWYVTACVAGFGTVLPLLLQQYSIFPNGGAIAGQINWNNAVSVIGTPFGTRVGTPVNARSIIGALVMLFAVGTLLFSRRGQIRARWLLVALGVFGALGLFGLDLAGKSILITRYTAVIAPLLVTVIAAACTQLTRPGAAALATATIAVSAIGLLDNHSTSGFYPPARQVVDYVASRQQPGDFMLTPGFPLTDTAIFYYVTRRTHPKLHFLGLQDPAQRVIFHKYKRLWLVGNPPAATDAAALKFVQPLLRKYHWRALSVEVFDASIALGVVLAEPVRR
jgi:uncharacterized membrane protein